MADNTQMNSGTGGDLIASDDLATLNGGASSGIKVQRVKIGSGVDSDFKDATTTTPIPVSSLMPLTASSPASASVEISSASALSANSSRKGLVMINLSSSNISLGIGTTAVLNQGITLTPFGTWVMDQYTFTTAVINAIAGTAASTLSIQEFA